MEKEWIQAFAKGINAKGNANGVVEELNTGHQIHLLLQ